MATLYETIINKHGEKSQYTANPTLDVFDSEYCKILDSMVAKDSFVADRVGKTINELDLAGGIDYNEHYRNAFDSYNEAVCYFELRKRGFEVNNIPEQSTPTPDFEIPFLYPVESQDSIDERVFIEIKSLSFAGGNKEYKDIQEAALAANISIEEQHKRGKQICISEYEVSPLGKKDTGPTYEIEEINKKINNNIKKDQFLYGSGKDTILLVDLSQYTFPFNVEECLPVYPCIKKKYSSSGRLWMLAFGREGERIYGWPEYEGKGVFDRDLSCPGILNCNDFIKGIIFTSGTSPQNKKIYGFCRYEDNDTPIGYFISKSCDFFNDNLSTNGFRLYNNP